MDSTKEQTSVKSCCVTGHLHEGTPQGTFQQLHGLRTYVVTPPATGGSEGGKTDTIVLLTDIYGPDYINTQLVADEWAKAGFKVVIPDVFVGDPVPIEHIRSIHPKKRDQDNKSLLEKAKDTAITSVDVGPWMYNHREAVVKPLIDTFVKGVRDDPGTGKIGSIGFCWGARYVLLLARDDAPTRIDVGVTYHASFVTESDVEGTTKVPVALIKGTADWMFSDSFLEQLENNLRPKLGDKLFVKKFPDAPHGFAVRGDDMVASEKQQKEEANNDGIAFVKKWFGST